MQRGLQPQDLQMWTKEQQRQGEGGDAMRWERWEMKRASEGGDTAGLGLLDEAQEAQQNMGSCSVLDGQKSLTTLVENVHLSQACLLMFERRNDPKYKQACPTQMQICNSVATLSCSSMSAAPPLCGNRGKSIATPLVLHTVLIRWSCGGFTSLL